MTCDKYSTYPSRSKEHHAGGDLFGKQHEIVVGQILSSSLTKIIPIPRSLAFYQVTKYVTTCHVLHDEYRVNLRDVKQRKKRINPMSRLLTAYQKKKKTFPMIFFIKQFGLHEGLIFWDLPLQEFIFKNLPYVKGKSRIAPLMRFPLIIRPRSL